MVDVDVYRCVSYKFTSHKSSVCNGHCTECFTLKKETFDNLINPLVRSLERVSYTLVYHFALVYLS